MNADDILTTQEAAVILGAHIETVRRLARKGAIPAFKIGKDWRFSRDALHKWTTEQQLVRRYKPTVLVIDDDPSITKLLRQIILPLGCQVITAGTGIEGLEIVARQSVDLVLLDLKMPEMNGPQFIDRLRQQQEQTPVIIVSGYPDSDLMAEALRFGPLMLIRKPVDKGALVSSVQMALHSQLTAPRERMPFAS
ncbi:MAG: response regulator [Desulfosarcinaceae bacterium]|jgi:excisionase family DNA binding protein